MMQGDREGAENILKDVLTRQPTAEPALTMLANTYVAANHLDDAVALVERAHAAEPNLLRVTVTLGDLYIRSNHPQKALDLTQNEKGANASRTDLLSLKAAAYLALGQRKEARGVYSDILKQDPSVIGARRQLVALLIEAGEFESARDVLQAGIANDPHNYQLYQDFVMVDLKSTGMDAALATADRLQSQDRDFPAIKALKGDIYLASNRPQDAAAAYKDAYNSAPSSLLVTRLSSAYLRSGQADEASHVLLDWIDKHSDDMAATEQLSEIAIAQHKLDDADKYLQAILKQKPHNAVALNNLAWVYQQQGKDEPAQALARQAYVLSPSPQTADTLGWILTTSGDPRNGATLLRQATGDGTTDPRILYHFAVALNDSGDKDGAKKALQTVVANQAQFKEKELAQKLLDDLSKGT
jgi:putative PEP-CTERM system TPR-repeat lipoprotein